MWEKRALIINVLFGEYKSISSYHVVFFKIYFFLLKFFAFHFHTTFLANFDNENFRILISWKIGSDLTGPPHTNQAWEFQICRPQVQNWSWLSRGFLVAELLIFLIWCVISRRFHFKHFFFFSFSVITAMCQIIMHLTSSPCILLHLL